MGLLMSVQITEYLRQKLTEVGTAGFEQISVETGVRLSFIRKFFYEGGRDPRVSTVQPLLDYFLKKETAADHPGPSLSDAKTPASEAASVHSITPTTQEITNG